MQKLTKIEIQSMLNEVADDLELVHSMKPHNEYELIERSFLRLREISKFIGETTK